MWIIRDSSSFLYSKAYVFSFVVQDCKNIFEVEGGTSCLKLPSGGGEVKASNTTQVPCAILTDFTLTSTLFRIP